MSAAASHSLTDPFDRPLTHHDLDHTPDDGNRYELIDGIIHVTPFPSPAHQRAATALTALLYTHVQEHQLGEVFAAGLKVVLDEPTGVGPDLVYISHGRLDAMNDDGYHGVPDLLVEVLSSRPALDTQIKKQKYERAGVPHYWILDPEHRQLFAYRFEKGQYRLIADPRGDETFEPDLFPGLTISLGRLWPRSSPTG
jgi:Uma2 family endonuclease